MGKRIAERIARLGWEQVDLLARVPGLSAGTLSALIRRDSIKSAFSVQIAQALGVTHAWLANGEGPMEGEASGVELQPFAPSIRVPLLAWEELRPMCESHALFTGEPASGRWIAAIDSKPSRESFAVRLDSDAMTAPAGTAPSFPRGTVLICDTQRAPKSGDYVIACDPQTNHPTFKRLTSDAGRWYLVALNPVYPTVALASLDGAVIAVVCEWVASGAL